LLQKQLAIRYYPATIVRNLAGSPSRRHRAEPGLEDPISTGISLFSVLFFVVANGFFVATEFALVAVRRTRMQQLEDEGEKRAGNVLDLLNHLDTYIAATQLGITLSSLALGWIGEPAVGHLIEPWIHDLPFLPENRVDTLSKTISFILAFSFITALHIVIGELAPKSLALQRPESTSMAVAKPIRIFFLIFRPAIYSLNWVGNWVVRQAGIQPAAGHEQVQSAEELQFAIEASREAGLVDETAHDLVNRAFDFPDLAARQVMVPRTEMAAIPLTASLPEVLAVAADEGYTRLPVYDGDTDHIVGLLNVKRLMPFLRHAVDNDNAPQSFTVAEYLSEPLYVPESLPAPSVLRLMKEQRTQLAVVIDEYGGTAGIISLQDLIEELIGDVDDEEGNEAPVAGVATDPDLIDGLTPISFVIEVRGLNFGSPDDLDVETIGGYVFHNLGREARLGDEVTMPDGERLRVEELDGLRIAKIRLLPPIPAEDEDEPASDPSISA
jgi:CBS domain containing-hemolysin-like protein